MTLTNDGEDVACEHTVGLDYDGACGDCGAKCTKIPMAEDAKCSTLDDDDDDGPCEDPESEPPLPTMPRSPRSRGAAAPPHTTGDPMTTIDPTRYTLVAGKGDGTSTNAADAADAEVRDSLLALFLRLLAIGATS